MSMMHSPAFGTRPTASFWRRRFRFLVSFLMGLFVLSAVLIFFFDHHDARWRPIAAEFDHLATASSADEFEAVVRSAAKQEDDPLHPGAVREGIQPLRTSMLIDSLGLEPAYGGLLVLFLLAFRLPGRPARQNGWDVPLHLACLFLAGAVMCDLAENGMVVRAAEDGLDGLLAQSTVEDVHQATRLKWLGLGLASFCTGVLGLGFARRVEARADVNRAWLRLGSWAAVAVAPLVVLQIVGPSSDPVVDGLLRSAPTGAFTVAMSALWLGLRRLDPTDPGGLGDRHPVR